MNAVSILILSLAAASAAGPEVSELPLEDALAALDAQNLTVAQARARAEEAAGLARQAAAAALPSLSVTGTYLRNSEGARIAIGELLGLPDAPPPVVIQPEESFTGTAALRVPLVAPAAWLDLAAARDGARAARRSSDAVRTSLRAGFAQAAHAARAAEEVVEAAARAVETAGQHADRAGRRVAAGTAAPLDHLRARTDLVAREGELVRARSELARARLALGVLLGRDGPVRVVVPEPDDGGPLPDPAELVPDALARRPELAAREAQVDAARDGVRSAWSRLAPTLGGTVAAFRSDVAYPTGERDGWRATLDLTWSLYDGGHRYGKRRQAEAALAGARAAEGAQRLAVAQEVRDAVRDLAVARERFRLAGQQRALAAEAAGVAGRSFEAGLASALDVVDANDRLFAADVGLAEARARLAAARIALDHASGRSP